MKTAEEWQGEWDKKIEALFATDGFEASELDLVEQASREFTRAIQIDALEHAAKLCGCMFKPRDNFEAAKAQAMLDCQLAIEAEIQKLKEKESGR